jgi:hypothetical protein
LVSGSSRFRAYELHRSTAFMSTYSSLTRSTRSARSARNCAMAAPPCEESSTRCSPSSTAPLRTMRASSSLLRATTPGTSTPPSCGRVVSTAPSSCSHQAEHWRMDGDREELRALRQRQRRLRRARCVPQAPSPIAQLSNVGDAPIAAAAVAQASRTANCPLVPALDTTWSLRDSTNSRNVVNPSDFSLKAGSIRCIWLLSPAA